MPVHDWSRVSAGTFHAFHLAWIAHIQDVLNTGLLPASYYAMAEQIAGDIGPDVLTLQMEIANGIASEASTTGAHPVAVALAPPRVRFTAQAEMDAYVLKQKHIVIHHSSDDRIIALIEIVSPGNKASRHSLRSFVDKAIAALYRGYHLLIADLHPPGPRDPQGIHGAIWAEFSDEEFALPLDKRLTLAAYSAGQVKKAYVEPIGVGDPLPDMPLFLEPEIYINVPLEMTYQVAWRGVPQRWRRVLET